MSVVTVNNISGVPDDSGGGGTETVVRGVLGATVTATNTGSTTNVASLSPALGASKTYKAVFYLAFNDPVENPVIDIYPSYPANVVAAIWANESGQQNVSADVTPSNNALALRLTGPGATYFYTMVATCTVTTADAGTLTFGFRNVGAGTVSLLEDISFYELTEIA